MYISPAITIAQYTVEKIMSFGFILKRINRKVQSLKKKLFILYFYQRELKISII